MRRDGLILAGFMTAAALSGPASSAPADRSVPPPGAESCSGCHGDATGFPDIAGKPAAEIEAAMAGFRDGARPATIMGRIAKGFTPDETREIAAWLSSQGGTR
ncbi:hypothetical protein [Methylopila sp. M107]|uniref:c-type cytochrome n=1 Tax=Methylopila sp. M107 TaxID=1101190 RepID=UPI00036875E8|nr:hypothetical protein [Methylopila sp. M107]